MIVLLRCIPVLLLIATSGSSEAQCSCDDPNAPNAQTCHTLFRTLESSLLNNGSNVYKLRKLLSLSPELPELVNVTYYLEFISTDSFNTSDDFGGLPICTCNTLSITFNQTYLNIGETIARRYGWTSIGIYTLIHPALLNLLQIQLPFAVIRLHIDKFPFLWNGRNQLPSISLHLSIHTDGLTCIPSDSQVDGVMKSLTSLLEFYAKSETKVGDEILNSLKASYTLDGLYVSNWKDNLADMNGNRLTKVTPILIPEIFCVISSIVIVSVIVGVVFKTAHDMYRAYKKVENEDLDLPTKLQGFVLLGGFLICMDFFGVAMIIAEFSTIANLARLGFVWKQLFLYAILIVVLFISIFSLVCLCTNKIMADKKSKLFMSTIIVILIVFDVFVILWIVASLYATVLLTLAYPLHVITIAFFHVTFVFAMTVVFAVILSKAISYKFYKNSKLTRLILLIFGFIVIVIFASAVYYVVVLGITLTVVQRLVPESGVVQVLLLLPSVLLFLGGWLIKRRFFAATGLSKFSRKVESEIVAEFVHLSFPIKKRAQLGRHLGIPSSALCEIELQALQTENTKKTALTGIINHWFDGNKSASYATFMDIFENKMKIMYSNFAAEYDKKVTEGDISMYGSTVCNEKDIGEVSKLLHTQEKVTQLGRKLNLSQDVLTQCLDSARGTASASELTLAQAYTQNILHTWISLKKENATWIRLLRKFKAIDPDVAQNIKIILLRHKEVQTDLEDSEDGHHSETTV